MAHPSASWTDAQIIAVARSIYNSPVLGEIRGAHQAGQPIVVSIDGCNIQYEPLPFSGMTAFPNGFVIGKEAFASEPELKKTLLHELYRLCRSAISQGADAERASIRAETNAAFEFAERAFQMI